MSIDAKTANSLKQDATEASDAPKEIRGRWRKGQSGNREGRPRVVREVRDLARKHGAKAIKRLVELMDGDNPRVAVAAAVALLDRGYGKPPQAITGKDGGPLAVEMTGGRPIATAADAAALYAAMLGDATLDISGVTFAAQPRLPSLLAPAESTVIEATK